MSQPKKISKKLWGDRNARLMSAANAPARALTLTESSADSSNESVYKLGTVLQGLTVDGDSLILTYPPGEDTPTVAFATGIFTPLVKRKVSASLVTLHRSVGLKSGSVLVFDTDDSNRADLGLPDETVGSIAMVAVELGLEGSLSVAIYQGSEHGRFGPRHVSALQASCQLASGFASAHDPVPPEKLESQVRIDSLESEVREAKEFYGLLLGSINQCYWMLDLDSRRILTVSDNFEDVWGASRTILTEGGLTGFMSTVDMEDRDHVLSNFHTRLGYHFDQEFRVVSGDGEKRWMWLRVSPVEGEIGEVAKLVFIADDVTERKNEEERMRAKEAELISRARALAVVDLATGVAHEINNPLAVIVGKCDELLRLANNGKLDQAAVTKTVDRIQSTSLRISEIVKSLKSMSRHDRAEIAISISLAEIAREVRDVVSERFKAAGVRLEIEIPDESVRAEMNGTLIAQLILNLVSNAFDAAKNENEKWVRVEFTDDKDSVYIGVTDSGSGIPIKIRSRIFDPFFTTKTPGQGTGLGLSLATSIAVHHHGSLRLDTFSSRTRFVFQLPKVSPGPSPL
ncbi:MAG: ATP-binding protein [Bdellovibrionota bacterium]